MKKRWIAALAVPVAVLGWAWHVSGLSAAYVTHGPSVAAGIGAKLLCSAEFVMEAPRDQAWEDVVQYSPILEQLTVKYDQGARSVTASFWGISTQTASFINGLGCALDFSPTDQR